MGTFSEFISKKITLELEKDNKKSSIQDSRSRVPYCGSSKWLNEKKSSFGTQAINFRSKFTKRTFFCFFYIYTFSATSVHARFRGANYLRLPALAFQFYRGAASWFDASNWKYEHGKPRRRKKRRRVVKLFGHVDDVECPGEIPWVSYCYYCTRAGGRKKVVLTACGRESF